MTERTFDVVAYGSTGFTGRLVARYLAEHGPKGLRWALGGRNETALKALREEIEAQRPTCPPTGVVVADVNDAASLRAMAKATKVVLTTVGPYAEYGEPLVEACVEEKTDYVDITGEPAFVERIIERFDERAREAGVRIVNTCGFDSIPHDLGVYYTIKQLPSGAPLTVEGFVQAKGNFSGGTWESAIRAMARYREFHQEQLLRRVRKPRTAEARKVRSAAPALRYVSELGSWAVPLPTIDPQVVLRSARSLGSYGPEFRYGHYARVRRLPTVLAGIAGVGALFTMAQWKPTREWLLKVRKSGEGPSEEQRSRSTFTVSFVGRGGGRKVRTEVRGGDPGYDETAKMVAESAIALAVDKGRLPRASGVLTPAVAMGDVLLERLQNAGITFEVVSEEEAN